jgi:sortilin (neurotensin receptor 3)
MLFGRKNYMTRLIRFVLFTFFLCAGGLLLVESLTNISLSGVLAAGVPSKPPSLASSGNAVPPPVPGQWVSIGPDHIFSPALPNASPPVIGDYNAVGRLTTIAINSTDPQIIYVGSPGELGREGCGIWKTTDGGATWEPIGDSLPTLAVAAIALDPADPDRIYIATADKGVFRSDDAGANWISLSDPLPVRTNTADGDRTALLINPTNPDVMYLSTDNGVQRSTDGGHTWPVSLSLGPGHEATNLVMDPLNPEVLYAGILGKGVYKTTTGGAGGNDDWKLQSQFPLPVSIPPIRGPLLAISHSASDLHETVYAMYPNFSGTGIGWDLFRTTDGTTWSGPLYSCAGGAANCLFVVIAADPANKDLVFIGGPLLYISEIGIKPFTPVPPADNDRQPASPHGDYWELAFDPTNTQNVFAGSDGGIYRSTNHGLTGSWSFIGDGITNVEMYDIALSITQPSRILAGTQDSGNILYSGSPLWSHIPPQQVEGGDGSAVAIDPTNPDILYAMGQAQDSLSQSLDGGQTPLLPFYQGLPPTPTTSPPGPNEITCAMYQSNFFLQVDPALPTTLLASCRELYRTSTNVSPGNWQKFFISPSGDVVRSAIDSVNVLYYVGTSTGHVFAVPVDGSPWQELLIQPNGKSISDIELDPAHPELVYASVAPPFTVDRPCAATNGQGRIYQLVRQSPLPNAAFATIDITGGLQNTDLCVNALAVDPHIPRTLYAATNRGVYRGRSNATGGPWIWVPYDDGLPLADVRDLEVHPVTAHIFAATYGRSAFELIPEMVLSIGIDIKPDSSENVINIKNKGTVTVAILSDVTFDAANEVDQSSLRFGRTGTEASLATCNKDAQDVDSDGLLDLVCHFYTSLTGFQAGDTVGYLKALTADGIPIEGSDTVKINH